MRIAEPNWLLLLWVIPALAVFYLWAFRKRTALLERFASVEMLARLLPMVSRRRQRLKAALLSTAMVAGIFALLRPQWGFHWEEITRKGVDIIVAVDVSQSMMAQDVSPTRLERARRELEDLVNMLEGDRLGLIAFSGTAFTQCPLTLDYGAFQMFLELLSPDLLPVPGTNITEAIMLAKESFEQASSQSRALILITDGEDHGGDPLEAAKAAKEAGIRIYPIGVGEDAAPIPSPDGSGFLKDDKGEVVMSRLDEATLQKIALETGGAYVRSTSGNLDLERIYREGIRESLEAAELKSTRQKKWEERFQWPLTVAALLIVLEVFISERGRRRRAAAMAILAGLSWPGAPASAGSIWDRPVDQALEAYSTGDYETALQKLTDASIDAPDDPLLAYNLGNTYYKMGKFEEAASSYEKVLARSSDASLKAQAWYNLGNTAYRQGKLDKAVEAYEQALTLNPSDAEAKRNLELVRREIQRRMEQQKKQEQEAQANQQQSEEGAQEPQQGDEQSQQEQAGEEQGEKGQSQQGQQGEQKSEGRESGQKQSGAEPGEQEQGQGDDKKEAGAEEGEGVAASGRKGQQDEQGQEASGNAVPAKLTKEEAEQLLRQIKDEQGKQVKMRPQPGQRAKAPGGKPW